MRWLIALGVVTGCYSPQLSRCEVQCGSGSPCPADLSCGDDHYCHASDDPESCRSTTLSITTSGNGGGHVTSQPGGVDCSTNDMSNGCDDIAFPMGTMITLTETHFGSGSFGGWGGDACNGSSSNTCTFTIQMPMTVNARF